MAQVNKQLWSACLNNPKKIRPMIKIKRNRDNVDIFAFLTKFHTRNRMRIDRLTSNPEAWLFDIPSEAAISIVLKAYKPFADTETAGLMFKALCICMSTPDSMHAFITLYADMLTSIAIKDGLSAACASPRSHTIPFQFSRVVEACIETIDGDAYWQCVSICCHDKRTDLVRRLISTCSEPSNHDSQAAGLIICMDYCSNNSDTETARMILDRHGESACRALFSSYSQGLDILKIVFAEYQQLLTRNAIEIGLSTVALYWSPSSGGDPVRMHMYIDHMENPDNKESFDQDFLLRLYTDTFDKAVAESWPEITDVLLKRCGHMLHFRSGHRIAITHSRYFIEVKTLLMAFYGCRVYYGDYPKKSRIDIFPTQQYESEMTVTNFLSACSNRDLVMVRTCVDTFECLKWPGLLPNACIRALHTAIANSADDVVEILLSKRMSILRFEKGIKAKIDAPLKAESKEEKATRRTADKRIKELLQEAYGSRLTITASSWAVKAETS